MPTGAGTLLAVVVAAVLAGALVASASAVDSRYATAVRALDAVERTAYARVASKLARPAARPASRPTAPKRAGYALSALESGLLARVNAVRRWHGLRPLRLSAGLSRAADLHSRQMVSRGFFEHESADGSPFWRRVERHYSPRGYGYWEVGENLVYGSPDIGAVVTVRMWMNSPGHRQNLLSKQWREIGLGAVHVASAPGEFEGDPVTVVTADFGVRR